MDFYTLDRADIRISGLALGTWAFSGAKIWGESDDTESIRTVHCALERGINLFDTAEKYGNGKAEEVLGAALKGRRQDAVIATKIFTDHLHYDDVISCCEASLKRLQTDYIDLYQIHWPTASIPLEETFRAFETLKRDGKIRAVSVCNAGPSCIREMAPYGIAMNQLPYALIWRVAEKKIIPASEQAGIPVWAYVPLAQGLLTGKFRSIDDVPLGRRETRFYSSRWQQGLHHDPGFEEEIFAFLGKLDALCKSGGITQAQAAFSFLKRRPIVKSILAGARSVHQLEQNLDSYEMQVPDALMEEIEALSEPLKECMGENADLWISDGGGRFY